MLRGNTFFLYLIFLYCVHACWVASVVSNTLWPWAVACQAPLTMGFSRQKYGSGLPCSPPGGTHPIPGIKPMSLVSPVLTGGFFTDSASWEAHWFSVRGQFHYPGDTSPYLEIALTVRIWSGEYCFWYLVYRHQATDAVQHPMVHWKVSPIKNYSIPNFSSAKVETPCSVAQNPHAVLNKVNVRML